MIAIAAAFVRHDLRAAPSQVVAVAVLLGSAAAIPSVLSIATEAGVVVAVAVAALAATMATTSTEARRQTLERNGSGPGIDALVALGSVTVPGLLAAPALIVANQLDAGPPLTTTVLCCLVVPLLVAPATALLARRPPGAGVPRWMRRAGWVVAVAVTVLASPVLALPLIMWATGRWLERRAGGVVTTIAAAAATLGMAWVAGQARSWVDLFLIITLGALPLAVAVARLGLAAVAVAGAAGSHLGPTLRLAAGPLQHRPRALAPVVIVLAIVTALAALDATIGASFGEREERKERAEAARPEVRATAGTSPDQAIGVVTASDREIVRSVAEDVAQREALSVVVIERLGSGGTEVPTSDPDAGTYDIGGIFSVSPTVKLAQTGPGQVGPTWIGVIAAADMDGLGLGSLAPNLERGEVVVLNGTITDGGQRPELSFAYSEPGEGGALPQRSVTADLDEVPALLPGALVSPEVAAATGFRIGAGRVVVAPATGRPGEPDRLVAAAREVVGVADTRTGPTDTNLGSDGGVTQLLAVAEAGRPVSLGDERVELDRPGPLNDVPVLSNTRSDARAQILQLGILAVLASLAGVMLLVGSTRSEDGVLLLQGAPPRLRSVLVAIQAGLMAGSASVLAAAVGIGLPAISFAAYGSGRGELPPIPLVVPWEVTVGLVALPLLAATVAMAFVAMRPSPSAGTLLAQDELLAWRGR